MDSEVLDAAPIAPPVPDIAEADPTTGEVVPPVPPMNDPTANFFEQ